VEDAVFSHPAVAEVAVIGVPDDKWGEMVTALVVLAEGQSVTEAELIAHTRERIAGYKAPKRVEFRDAIPRTATGKIQKFKLRESFWSASDRQVH
jgi:acyl-CoA synthetase (AMP-forming)/AMP-acid ligase II